MWKQSIIAVGLVFTFWMVVDNIIVHGIVLRPVYQSMPQFWKPLAAIDMAIGALVCLVVAICFVGAYAALVRPKSTRAGLKYGILMGLLIGTWMGLGSYSVMPIPFLLAIAWLTDFIIQMVVAGAIAGAIVKDRAADQRMQATD